ncbi:uncharacterized protein LOC117931951 [Vitis riparia]|uniref:uncharacterized protein LOC117931951 n=1 Tax=Vitis riparia TaxID=96939 RepID=UPI00155B0A87|nr:uncharacterized protein LOC117931951 [Vitis riparia]
MAGVAVAAVNVEREEHWKHFDNSVNVVSFGFVATAILISMFLVMAILTHGDPEVPMMFDGKLRYPSPKMTVYARGVSVLIPREQIPTYIAHPAPAPCPPERIVPPSIALAIATPTFSFLFNS